MNTEESDDPILLKEGYSADDEMDFPTSPASSRTVIRRYDTAASSVSEDAIDEINLIEAHDSHQSIEAPRCPRKEYQVFVEIPVHPKSAAEMARYKRWNAAQEASYY